MKYFGSVLGLEACLVGHQRAEKERRQKGRKKKDGKEKKNKQKKKKQRKIQKMKQKEGLLCMERLKQP